METVVFKRSVVIRGHKTSISLENAFWKADVVARFGRPMESAGHAQAIPEDLPLAANGP
jgi:predicted DNA-binding ribbon-helix-helix protein